MFQIISITKIKLFLYNSEIYAKTNNHVVHMFRSNGVLPTVMCQSIDFPSPTPPPKFGKTCFIAKFKKKENNSCYYRMEEGLNFAF